ncbi:MAG: hypothetical protein Q7S12_02480 [bacterium]|nr:hypothetical protein [bacterium]
MDQKKFEKNKKLMDKYHDFIFSLPGLMCVGWDDKEITIDIKPENVALAEQFISNYIEGVPIKIIPRTNPPSF